MQLIALRSLFNNSLSSCYDLPEIESIFARIAGFVLNYSKIEIHQNLYESIDPQSEKKILEYLNRLSKCEPLQYVMGFTEFYNQRIQVDPRVLIPRSETEYLVDLIVKEHLHISGLHIIDLCTGSGCIAIALSKSMLNAIVTATDVSAEALELARLNVQYNTADVQFIQDDLLNPLNSYLRYDIIVSNPPYVRQSERTKMHANVLNFEPPLALFVPDSDPLKFYKAIANFGLKHLRSGGKVYLEINEKFGKEVMDLFNSSGYNEVEIQCDINQKDRYLIACI
jgi:release factor glutamine methyltransferase